MDVQITGDYIISILRKDKQVLEKNLGVNALALFGSYAKNKQTQDSDIDLLLEQKEVSYANLMATLLFSQNKFPGKKIIDKERSTSLRKISFRYSKRFDLCLTLVTDLN